MAEKVYIYNPHEFDGKQKIVQLNVKDKPYLLYGGSFHSKILEDFLDELSLRYERIKIPKFDVKIPSLTGDLYSVVGMGEANLYFAKKLYTGMYGKSKDYDIGINPIHRDLLIQTLKQDGWKCL